MSKLIPPLVPFGVVTEIELFVLTAVATMANVAVSCVALATFTFDTEIPFAVDLTVVKPTMKFVPVSVTPKDVPVTPLAGLMLVSVGGRVADGFTVRVKLCTAFEPTPFAAVKEML